MPTINISNEFLPTPKKNNKEVEMVDIKSNITFYQKFEEEALTVRNTFLTIKNPTEEQYLEARAKTIDMLKVSFALLNLYKTGNLTLTDTDKTVLQSAKNALELTLTAVFKIALLRTVKLNEDISKHVTYTLSKNNTMNGTLMGKKSHISHLRDEFSESILGAKTLEEFKRSYEGFSKNNGIFSKKGKVQNFFSRGVNHIVARSFNYNPASGESFDSSSSFSDDDQKQKNTYEYEGDMDAVTTSSLIEKSFKTSLEKINEVKKGVTPETQIEIVNGLSYEESYKNLSDAITPTRQLNSNNQPESDLEGSAGQLSNFGINSGSQPIIIIENNNNNAPSPSNSQ